MGSRERCEILADYLIENQSTVRDAATKFDISKSTVHKDVTERLFIRNRRLYNEVRSLLEKNKAERHLRGGEATKKKYLSKS
ncbi:MAG: sporulation transcriptional regulator SpoIIID [Clostridia bacterium]|nr:sporulation transcriptional regulator SpoIIID [Clostridia bacterium]